MWILSKQEMMEWLIVVSKCQTVTDSQTGYKALLHGTATETEFHFFLCQK